MAVLSLPLTFSNSFWTEDYRKGLEVLYAQLEQVCTMQSCPCWQLMIIFRAKGVVENTEIAQFIRVSVALGRTLYGALTFCFLDRHAPQRN